MSGPVDRIAALRSCRLFGSFSSEELKVLAEHSKELHVGAKQTLFTAGDASTGLLVIADGKVEIVGQAEGRNAVVLMNLGPGEPLASVSLLGTRRHMVTAVALENTRILTIGTDDLRQIHTAKSQLALKLLVAVAHDLGARLADAETPLRAFALEQASKR